MEYTLRGDGEEGWLTAPVDAPRHPDVLPPREGGNVLGGPCGYLVQHVLDELEQLGFPEDEVNVSGLVVDTTFDRQAQGQAVRAVHEVTGPTAPDGVYRALVSVEPGTGRVRAEYGGRDYVARPFNAATQGRAQAGSSFKALRPRRRPPRRGLAGHPLRRPVAAALRDVRGEELRAGPGHAVRAHRPRDGGVLHEAEPDTERVLEEGVAAQVALALRRVVEAGTGADPRLPDRPAAGKTGTGTPPPGSSATPPGCPPLSRSTPSARTCRSATSASCRR